VPAIAQKTLKTTAEYYGQNDLAGSSIVTQAPCAGDGATDLSTASPTDQYRAGPILVPGPYKIWYGKRTGTQIGQPDNWNTKPVDLLDGKFYVFDVSTGDFSPTNPQMVNPMLSNPTPGESVIWYKASTQYAYVICIEGPLSAAQTNKAASNDAELVFLAGDIDNLGFGWPQGFDVFSGSSTPPHSYPWKPDANDPAGTDRIMVGTSYDGHPPAGQDGYVSTTSRPDNQPEAIVMQYDLGDTKVKSAILQMFVDDFQSPVWMSKFQVKINGRRAPFLEEVLNSLDQTGPIGKLITVQIPDEFLGDVSSSVLNIYIDDPTTGAGDGYAVDFVRLLINPKTLTNVGTVSGMVSDAESREPIKDATASASGVIRSNTDVNGEYILDEVPAGLVAVNVSKSGYVSQTKTVDLTSGGDAKLDFQCKKMAHVDEGI